MRTMIVLPSDLVSRGELVAAERGMTFAQFVQRLLESEIVDRRIEDPLFADKAVFQGDAPSDLAAAHDRYLYEENA